MTRCRWTREVEHWIDGERGDPAAVEKHVAACEPCAAYLADLDRVRQGVQIAAVREAITDAQLPAFMEGIRERLEPPARRHRGFWALASLSAAALVVALLAFSLLTGGPQEVLATEIESFNTELEGATVTSYLSEDGTATVWVTVPAEGTP